MKNIAPELIRIRDHGLSPNPARVRRGQPIIWINESESIVRLTQPDGFQSTMDPGRSSVPYIAGPSRDADSGQTYEALTFPLDGKRRLLLGDLTVMAEDEKSDGDSSVEDEADTAEPANRLTAENWEDMMCVIAACWIHDIVDNIAGSGKREGVGSTFLAALDALEEVWTSNVHRPRPRNLAILAREPLDVLERFARAAQLAWIDLGERGIPREQYPGIGAVDFESMFAFRLRYRGVSRAGYQKAEDCLTALFEICLEIDKANDADANIPDEMLEKLKLARVQFGIDAVLQIDDYFARIFRPGYDSAAFRRGMFDMTLEGAWTHSLKSHFRFFQFAQIMLAIRRGALTDDLPDLIQFVRANIAYR